MKEISKHFTLQQLAEGVYAAIAIDGGAAICNAGLIDLGGQVVVYDTFLTPQAAGDLLQASLELFGRKPDLVVNSHYHNDHIWGNQVFLPEAQIIATGRTRELMLTDGKDEVYWYTANSVLQLEVAQEKYKKAVDEVSRQQAGMWVGYYAGLVETMPRLTVCLPSMTFESRLELHGKKVKAELLPFEKGHTQGDVVLYLKEEKVLFMSDLLFVGCHPYLADGDLDGLLNALQSLSGLRAEHFVPGHGPVGTEEDLHLMIEYIQYCRETAGELCREEDGLEARIKEQKPGGKFAGWRFGQFFQSNLRFLCQGLTAKKSE